MKIAQATSDNGIQLDEEMHDDTMNMFAVNKQVESAHASVQVPRAARAGEVRHTPDW